ncbi:class I SAM-dependent methyltransferase [Amycolatopsis tucumanensis]|uniref:Class I SAM-dependent methyltransferase n=1 Tax=Amycolatopsis tucumanensis TaxID=401106 RepID=A0ABP7HRZ3_9PSEU|nr:class I SAM-dependent methyltransferase [Amycolatopsis tucumanensis]MCF6420793.1 methyltransferase domain-containing protein [Amycolatopsis tucumanensis]
MTTTTFDEIKARQHKTWSSGDYGRVAWLTVPLAETLCAAADLRPGDKVLDVATGTGHVALAAARRFCRVTGIDYVPALLDVARRRAEAEGLDVRFREADAENLPCADGEWDVVLSAIGVMFTADHQRAADELLRVCRPGGTIAMASWTPAGFIGKLLATVGRHAPPPAGALPPTRWGTEETVRELFGDRVTGLTCTTATVREKFANPAHFADFFLTHYGPTHMAAQRLSPDGREAFRADLIALAEENNLADDGTFAADWEYLVAVATKTVS